EKLRAHMRVLKDRREKLLGQQAAAEKEGLGLLERLATERQKVVAEVAALRRRVEEQERLLLARLSQLGREVAGRRQERVKGLRQEVAMVSEKIHLLEEKCQQPAGDFLQDSRSILSRFVAPLTLFGVLVVGSSMVATPVGSEPPTGPNGRFEQGGEERVGCLEQDHGLAPAEALPEPGEEPPGLPPHNVAVKETLRRFQVSLTLDPETAHPRLVLSEDLKGVRWDDTRQLVPDNPKRFDSSRCVLGGRAFSGGQHYWEVVVGDGQTWAVGVAKES
ncbi:PREDICTED: E3 ubiquitin-protein ligase TRIM11-like, partial [Buceros rhinoceros silvestris]|uniref:E3 ubiquitin-protein ligase TRIM11-like n=1 Tax=Buceros rhinoceros silvestris TaxID=175836 RepID=UPI000528E20C